MTAHTSWLPRQTAAHYAPGHKADVIILWVDICGQEGRAIATQVVAECDSVAVRQLMRQLVCKPAARAKPCMLLTAVAAAGHNILACRQQAEAGGQP